MCSWLYMHHVSVLRSISTLQQEQLIYTTDTNIPAHCQRLTLFSNNTQRQDLWLSSSSSVADFIWFPTKQKSHFCKESLHIWINFKGWFTMYCSKNFTKNQDCVCVCACVCVIFPFVNECKMKNHLCSQGKSVNWTHRGRFLSPGSLRSLVPGWLGGAVVNTDWKVTGSGHVGDGLSCWRCVWKEDRRFSASQTILCFGGSEKQILGLTVSE